MSGLVRFIAGWLARRRDPKRAVGRRGERIAARSLRAEGYRVVARNARLGRHEIDLICEAPDGNTIVLVEVKARARRAGASASSLAVPPERAIDERKRRAMRVAAIALRRANGWESRPVRLDAVAVELPDRGEPLVRHWPGPTI